MMMETPAVEGLATSTKTTFKAIKITTAQMLLSLRSVMGTCSFQKQNARKAQREKRVASRILGST